MSKLLTRIVNTALFVTLASVLTLGATVVPVHAGSTKTFIALLNSGQEVPSNGSNAFGVAHLLFDRMDDLLCYSISYNALVGAELAAHFHGPASADMNAPVLFPIPEAGSPKNGCVGPLTSKQRKDLEKGLFYINVHSMSEPGGEIRGQVLQIKGAR